MKEFLCSSCRESWSVKDEQVNKVLCCPFCAFEIPKPKEIIVTSFETAIQKVINDLSVEVLKERKRFLAYLMDIGSQYKKEIHILSKACDESAFQRLYTFSTMKSDELKVEVAKFQNFLIEEEGISETWATFICEIFCSSFSNTNNLETIEPKTANSELSQTSSKYNKQSQIGWFEDFLRENFQIKKGDVLQFGKVTEWRVLDVFDDGVLLLDEKCSEQKPFNETGKKCSWIDSSLRKWLNDEYLKKYFSLEEIKYINSTTIKTATNRTYGGKIYDEEETTDRVFCLSDIELNKYESLIHFGYDSWLLRTTSSINGPTHVMTCENKKPYYWGCVVGYKQHIKPVLCVSNEFFIEKYVDANK